MSTSSIIKSFTILKGAITSLSTGLKGLLINTFTFEAMKESFCHSMVIAIGSAAHTHGHGIVLQKREIAFARRGTATIRMVE